MGRPKKKRQYTKSAAYWGKTKKAKKVKKVKGLSTECVSMDSGAPKKRGRPRKNPLSIEGSEVSNKVIGSIGSRRRGRPRKFKVEDGREPIPTRTSRHFGFCTGCKLSICSLDIKEKHNEYICPRCGKTEKLAKLAQELGLDRPKTKKEFLMTVNSTYVDWYGVGHSNLGAGKKNSDTISKVEDTIETVPLKDDEENLLENHDKDPHEII